MLKELAILKDSQPDNAALQCCDALFGSLADDAEKDALLRCVQSGMRAPESHVGCLAMDVRDYERFKLLFGKAISRHHGMEAGAMHSNILDDAGRPLEPTARVAAAWSLEDVEGVPANGVLDLANAGLEPLPMRCQAARNFGTFSAVGRHEHGGARRHGGAGAHADRDADRSARVRRAVRVADPRARERDR